MRNCYTTKQLVLCIRCVSSWRVNLLYFLCILCLGCIYYNTNLINSSMQTLELFLIFEWPFYRLIVVHALNIHLWVNYCNLSFALKKLQTQNIMVLAREEDFRNWSAHFHLSVSRTVDVYLAILSRVVKLVTAAFVQHFQSFYFTWLNGLNPTSRASNSKLTSQSSKIGFMFPFPRDIRFGHRSHS
jgi:hypothetical protein